MTNKRYTCNDNFFNHITSEESAYWLGILATDGNISKNRNVIKLGFCKKDKSHLSKFLQSIGSDHKIYYYKKRDFCEVNISSAQLKLALCSLGVTPNKSLNLKLNNIDETLQRHFWRGCIDGDGSLLSVKRKDRPSNTRSIAYNGSIYMTKMFASFISINLGINYKEPYRNHSIFCVKYGGNLLPVKIAKLLYDDSNIWLDRKYSTYLRWIEEM